MGRVAPSCTFCRGGTSKILDEQGKKKSSEFKIIKLQKKTKKNVVKILVHRRRELKNHRLSRRKSKQKVSSFPAGAALFSGTPLALVVLFGFYSYGQ